MSKINKNKGFTLVEVIIALAIMSIVGIGIVEVMTSAAKTKTSIEREVEYQSITSELISTVRSELANVSMVQVVNQSSIDLNEVDANGEKYCYIVSSATTGGVTIHGLDSTGNRVTTNIRENSMPNAISYMSFKKNTNSVEISAIIERTDITDVSGANVKPYTQSTTMAMDLNVLSDAATGYQSAIKYKKIK